MSEVLKYIIDATGERKSVLIPIKKWDKLNRDNIVLQNKLNVLLGIQKGLNEVKLAKNGGKKLQSLKEFLNESNR